VNLKNSGANVFFNVTTPKFAAQAIKKAADIGWKPIHLLNNVSASVGAVLKPAGLDASKGLITVQYLKDPTDPQWKNDQGYKDWLAFMEKHYPEGTRRTPSTSTATRWPRRWSRCSSRRATTSRAPTS
jgi:branched-chain amino acid transport system substrate-binding protein